MPRPSNVRLILADGKMTVDVDTGSPIPEGATCCRVPGGVNPHSPGAFVDGIMPLIQTVHLAQAFSDLPSSTGPARDQINDAAITQNISDAVASGHLEFVKPLTVEQVIWSYPKRLTLRLKAEDQGYHVVWGGGQDALLQALYIREGTPREILRERTGPAEGADATESPSPRMTL